MQDILSWHVGHPEVLERDEGHMRHLSNSFGCLPYLDQAKSPQKPRGRQSR